MSTKRHVVLIGLPGSGKTVVGSLVAEKLKAGFVDIDALLVRKEKHDPSDVVHVRQLWGKGKRAELLANANGPGERAEADRSSK